MCFTVSSNQTEILFVVQIVESCHIRSFMMVMANRLVFLHATYGGSCNLGETYSCFNNSFGLSLFLITCKQGMVSCILMPCRLMACTDLDLYMYNGFYKFVSPASLKRLNCLAVCRPSDVRLISFDHFAWVESTVDAPKE